MSYLVHYSSQYYYIHAPDTTACHDCLAHINVNSEHNSYIYVIMRNVKYVKNSILFFHLLCFEKRFGEDYMSEFGKDGNINVAGLR